MRDWHLCISALYSSAAFTCVNDLIFFQHYCSDSALEINMGKNKQLVMSNATQDTTVTMTVSIQHAEVV